MQLVSPHQTPDCWLGARFRDSGRMALRQEVLGEQPARENKCKYLTAQRETGVWGYMDGVSEGLVDVRGLRVGWEGIWVLNRCELNLSVAREFFS